MAVSDFARRRVGHADAQPTNAATDSVNHDKVVLLPVDNAGQGSLAQLLKVEMYPLRMEMELLCRRTDSQHADTLASRIAELSQALRRKPPTIEPANHPKASRTAIHGVELTVKWDSLTHMLMISIVEESFGVKFKLKELNKLKKVGDIIEILQEKLS